MTPNAEQEFIRQLETFRRQVEQATQFVFAYEAINEVALRNKRTLRALNLTAMFWNTVAGALQQAGFIAVGRIFDSSRRTPRTVNTVLRYAFEHREMFSKDALAARKRRGSANADEWLDDFLKNVHVPTASDFKRMTTLVKKHRRIYETQFERIRHRFVAHTEITEDAEIAALFQQTRRRDLHRLLTFLNQLHDALWEMLYNGRRLRLRPMASSPRSLVRRPVRDPRDRFVQERIVADTKTCLRLLTKATAPVTRAPRRIRVRRGGKEYTLIHR